jgi:hypothetical protein
MKIAISIPRKARSRYPAVRRATSFGTGVETQLMESAGGKERRSREARCTAAVSAALQSIRQPTR